VAARSSGHSTTDTDSAAVASPAESAAVDPEPAEPQPSESTAETDAAATGATDEPHPSRPARQRRPEQMPPAAESASEIDLCQSAGSTHFHSKARGKSPDDWAGF